ncbi:MAG: LPS-assembly protein LptD [Silicimonas sp.]|nr:LPS-assembly protein LptD [Silicimonas sp.]
MMRAFLVAVLLIVTPAIATAQELATLVADTITVDPAGRVTASGNVEVFYQGRRLRARSVSYDRNGDQLTILGPIIVTDADGTTFTADQAQLDRDLRNGVLTSARLVLDQQLQIAANEIARVGDRYTRLDQAVASACQVCTSNPTPLWEIRASRIIHDSEEQQLYFENAQVRVAGVPVFYFPRLRLPDPSLDRATGALIPRFRQSTDLGTGIKLPYFIAIGDHADLTVTPYYSSVTNTIEFRYRQLLRHGEIEFNGAISDDELEGSRGFFFGQARYRLARGFVAEGQLEFVSDPGYLFLYDYSDKDRLTNEFAITRVRDKDIFRVGVTEYRTLRESEIAIRDTLPDRFLEVSYRRNIPQLSFGGRTDLTIDAASVIRPSSDNIDGRDVNRIGAALDWQSSWVRPEGLVTSAELGLRLDAYSIGQDSTFNSTLTRAIPRAAVELRWPFSRRTQNGGTEVLEPVFRVDVADAGGDAVPLEDSTVVEFDEANLFSPTRYPGNDGVEDGTRVAAGVTWRRSDPQGWQADLAVGRVVNLDGDLGFAEGTGLTGDRSEWLVAARLSFGNDLSLVSRTLFDETVEFTLTETRIDWQADRFGLSSSYIFAEPEPAEGRAVRLSEWSFDGNVDLTESWSANTNWRYDFTANKATRAGLSLGYQNECVNVELSLSRRFATSTSVDPTTDFGFRVSLNGVGGREGPARNKCRG